MTLDQLLDAVKDGRREFGGDLPVRSFEVQVFDRKDSTLGRWAYEPRRFQQEDGPYPEEPDEDEEPPCLSVTLRKARINYVERVEES